MSTPPYDQLPPGQIGPGNPAARPAETVRERLTPVAGGRAAHTTGGTAGTSAMPVAGTDAPGIRYTQTRVVNVSPDVMARHHIVAGLRRDEAASAFRMLRTQVLRRMEHAGWRTLAVVSPAPDDGKTLVAVNLAISISRDKHHTALVVDFDLHRPSVAGCFELQVGTGVEDVLRGTAEVPQAMVNPGIDSLTLLPARGPLEDASEVMGSRRVADLTLELRDRYARRIVLFDLPPILATDDALAFLPNVDAVLLVVRDGKHTPEELARARELIHPVPVIGAVLNCADLRGQPYQYGYY